jgi:hypothetical protein
MGFYAIEGAMAKPVKGIAKPANSEKLSNKK